MKENDNFRVRFLEIGTYEYFCQIYTRMQATIEVVERKAPIVVGGVREINPLFSVAPSIGNVKKSDLEEGDG